MATARGHRARNRIDSRAVGKVANDDAPIE
jgi:hypothetical protein